MDAFDADVLIYAAVPGHPLGEQVADLFRSVAPATVAGIGSVLLLPEVLAKPLRDDATDEVRILAALLARLDLRPVDRATAELATALSSRYRLKAADATHLATAVGMGADRLRSTWAGPTQPGTTPGEGSPCPWTPGRSGSVGRPTSMRSMTCRAHTPREATWLSAFPCPTASPAPRQLPVR